MLNRLRERFAATYCAAADHHLRQPLLAISLYASALEARLADPEALRVLRGMQFSLRVLQQHLDVLLDLSNLEAGLVKPRLAVIHLTPLLEQAIEAERPIASHMGVELRIVRTSASVRCDPALLGRMVEHLLSKALVGATGGRITVGCRRLGRGRVRLQVAGAAIATAEPEGSAEVSIVQRLGRRLGHAVSVAPAAGRGALFCIDVERAG
jgi:signal transduction histidine kinase